MQRYLYAYIALLGMALGLFIDPSLMASDISSGVLGRQRLIYRFDFEEAKINNFENLPKHWYVIGRAADTADPNFMQHPLHAELVRTPGFPGYTEVRFNQPQQQPGNHSLYLGLNGGSAGAFIEIGTLPAIPTSDYLITASIRTEKLTHAGAKLSAYFVDNTGRRIEPSRSSSRLIRTSGAWDSVAVKLHGEHPQAAWIGLQVELSQPRFDPKSALGERQVVYQQVSGSAWIDDVSIWQMPRVTVESQSKVNIFRSPEKPRLTMQVRDLTGRALQCELTVYDHMSNLIARHYREIGQGAPIKWRWDPPITKHGWYLVLMKVSEPGTPDRPPSMIANTLSAMLWLPQESTLVPQDANRFTLNSQDIPEKYLQLLPELLHNSGLQSTIISVWDRDTIRTEVVERQEHLDSMIQELLGRGWHIGLSLNPLPKELAKELDLDVGSPLGAMLKPQDKWLPYLTPALIRHGQRIKDWHLGSSQNPEAFYIEQLESLIGAVDQEIKNTAPHPQIVIPWEISQSKPDENLGTPYFAIGVPVAVQPEHIGDHLSQWSSLSGNTYELHLDTPSAITLSHEQRINDLVFRMLYAWEANPLTLTIDRPWTRAAGRQTALIPDPLLGIFAQTAHRLAGRRVVGRLPIANGVQCLILKGSKDGTLAAWNRSASSDEAVIDMYLGKKPQVVDVWGNRKELPLVNGRHKVALGPSPIFIEGIDPELALFRASFKLEPKFIESTLAPHRRMLMLSNPWKRTISGNFILNNPPTWHVSPRRHHFSIASGQTASLPVDMQFPVYEVAGDKRISARFDFVANERYVVDISTSMELGLKNVDLDATLTIERNEQTGTLDAVVTQLISNTGSDETIALYAFASLPGYPRQERIVAQLKPGQTILRRFRFADAAEQIQTSPIRVGVRQTTGPAVLNKILSAEDL